MRKMISVFFICALFVFSACAAQETVITEGSTSMKSVIGILGEVFMQDRTEISFSFNPTGSAAGIQSVLEARCDIGLSSRELSAAEVASGLTAAPLAYDGIAVIVHPQNPLNGMTLEKLAAVFTGQITDWSALGVGEGEIVLIGREANSGTRDGFEGAIGTKGRCVYRQELTSAGDVITAVSANINAIGYTSPASVKEGVKVIALDGVLPTALAVREGSYPMRRPFLLVTRSAGGMKAAAREFYDFALSDAAAAYISRAGFIPANGSL